MVTKLNWGIIGTGNIAKKFAQALPHSRTGRLVAVGSRQKEKAERFGVEFGAANRHGSYEALLADGEVEAVYISTPHPMHAEWAIKAARAGKHILCEKPLGINHAQAAAIIEAARQNDVFLMEAFMYRCHPQTARLIEFIRQGAIGGVRLIRATFSFQAAFDPQSRLFSSALAGGGILDVGGYCTSAARLIAGVAMGGETAEPTQVAGCGHLGATGVDEWAIALLKFPGDIVAQLATGVSLNQDNVLQVLGAEGSIMVPWPWIPSREGGTTRIILRRYTEKEPEEVLVATNEHLYAIEADTVARDIERRQATWPAMTWDDTLGNMRTMDLWRQSIGMTDDLGNSVSIPTRVPG